MSRCDVHGRPRGGYFPLGVCEQHTAKGIVFMHLQIDEQKTITVNGTHLLAGAKKIIRLRLQPQCQRTCIPCRLPKLFTHPSLCRKGMKGLRVRTLASFMTRQRALRCRYPSQSDTCGKTSDVSHQMM